MDNEPKGIALENGVPVLIFPVDAASFVAEVPVGMRSTGEVICYREYRRVILETEDFGFLFRAVLN